MLVKKTDSQQFGLQRGDLNENIDLDQVIGLENPEKVNDR